MIPNWEVKWFNDLSSCWMEWDIFSDLYLVIEQHEGKYHPALIIREDSVDGPEADSLYEAQETAEALLLAYVMQKREAIDLFLNDEDWVMYDNGLSF